MVCFGTYDFMYLRSASKTIQKVACDFIGFLGDGSP